MRKIIEVGYGGELRTLIVEGDTRYSGPFFENIVILIAEKREGGKEWHCMHGKFHWDEGSTSRFSLLFNEMLNFVEQEEKVTLTEREVKMIAEKASIIYKMGKREGAMSHFLEYKLIYNEEDSISIESSFSRVKLREEMNEEEQKLKE